MDLITWLTIVGVLIALVTLILSLYKHWKSEKIKKRKKKTGLEAKRVLEEKYLEVLRRQLGRIGVVGPGFETISTRISETFTSLRISETRHCEPGFEREILKKGTHPGEEGYFSPEEVMERAFQKYRLLLIIGDPGSGKTTLLKYYAMTCLDKKQKILGFKEKEILPIFFPLRELKFTDSHPMPLQDNLAAWSEKCHLKISPDEFHCWLQDRETLVLLDGLDEISETEKRLQVCQWVKNAWSGLGKACFVLTSRPTGYRKIEGFELDCEHMRGDIMDFTPEQQELFLNRWFCAVFRDELPEGADPNEIERMELEAKERARAIIDFLNKKENKGVRELARVPMLLQIMAIIWKNREYLPGSRSELYDISLNYLLDYRDRRKNLKPLLPAVKARIVLAPTALWMQEKLRKDNAPQQDIHDFMKPILKTLDQPPKAQTFCINLRDRAGLIADYGEDHYIFRHKSFMEFLAGLQLVKESIAKSRRAAKLVRYFGDHWWEESLLFFISKSDDTIFDRFMHRFFQSKESRHLDANQQNLLQNLVKEAPQRKIDGLVKCLKDKKLNKNQRRYILDCLKTIRSAEAINAIEDFIKNSKDDEANLDFARDIVSDLSVEVEYALKKEGMAEEDVFLTLPGSFRNPFEDNVEYIKIPGGTYKFSVSKKMETVPDLYFCKYPVTNKRYRRFISYLEGNQTQMEHTLPLEMFAERLLEFAKTIEGYHDYLGIDSRKWQQTLRSRYDDEKGFKGDDQPVVGVSWFDARAYCFWISCLHWQAVAIAKKVKKPPDLVQFDSIFRLPTEVEWEWAAAGREPDEPDGSLREYPWAKSKSKGEPNPSLANYNFNVGATTPVGRFPDGSTPEGLMDMAGNVWEWMENSHEKYKDSFTLRGGSWFFTDFDLRCAARSYDLPGDGNDLIGFRVLRSQSQKLIL